MAKNLVIVESPAKAKTINKFLGKQYTVKASLGHVRDLVKSGLGVDLEDNFKPHYVTPREKSKVIRELKNAARQSEAVILALDPDREGEAIAWHLQELLKKELDGDGHFSRVTYNEITRQAIEKAFSQPRRLNMDKVNAQQARRILDRLVGYRVSPVLWRRIRGGSSAGRVQTVALRLLCEREKEIMAFKPERYRVFGARVSKQVEPADPFEIRLHRVDGEKGEIFDFNLASEIQEDLAGCRLAVSSVQEKEVSRRPHPPFITSTLQQAASNAFGFQPKRTMALAQKLYEGVDLGSGEGPTGLITYMRTDSVSLAGEALEDIRREIDQVYGKEYLPAQAIRYRSSKSAEEAHEAIRPAAMSRKPEELRGILGDAEWKLYSLIWKRAMACQMKPARLAQTAVEIKTDSERHNYIFRANASRVIFPGFLATWGRGGSGEEDEEKETYLPKLEEGEPLDVLEWLCEDKETQPPRRYSEASLIKTLEENGVGRPSTYASIITTLYNREYVERENRSLRPTKPGMEVNDFLVERLSALFEVDFTARMEEELDRIEEGKMSWTEMMQRFHEQLEAWIEEARAPKIDHDQLARLVDLSSRIKTFNPPVKQGRKTYCDETFVREISESFAKGQEITERQVNHLRRLVARYRDQIGALSDTETEKLGLSALVAEEEKNSHPPDETTFLKLAMLAEVEFEPPRKIGKKTFNDAEFVKSLRDQVESGRRLSDRQVQFLDRLVRKYAVQISNFESRAPAAGLLGEVEEDLESGPLLDLLAHVKTFNEPTVRAGRTWDDARFADSLRKQFEAKKALTERQRTALKKLLSRYHEQVPSYFEQQEALGLPEPKKRKGKRG